MAVMYNMYKQIQRHKEALPSDLDHIEFENYIFQLFILLVGKDIQNFKLKKKKLFV